jgi:Ca-activated chloride channel homolog
MAGEVNLIATLNRPQYAVLNTDQVAYVYVEANPASHVPIGAGSAPLNLTFVLDRSGSMSGKPIHDLRQAVKMALDRLTPQDLVSVVIFDDKADLIVPSQPALNKAMLMAQVDGIKERGGTQMSSGMQMGLAQLQQGFGAGRVNRMILLTDGETWEDQAHCRQLAQQAGQMGVPITSLGLGEEWNLQLLTDLAGASGGTYEYIDPPDKIVQVFQTIVSTMQGTLIANANLTLRLVLGVRPRAVWRVTPLIERLTHRALSDRDVQVSLGDLQQNGQSVLVELTFPPRQPGTYRMAQAEVSYDVPGSGLRGEKAQSEIMVAFTPDQVAAQAVNGRIMNIIEKVTAFKLQTQALDEAAAGNAAGATRKLRAAATRLLSLGEQEMAQQAQAAADQMAAGQQLSPKQTKRLHAATKKLDMSDLGL